MTHWFIIIYIFSLSWPPSFIFFCILLFFFLLLTTNLNPLWYGILRNKSIIIPWFNFIIIITILFIINIFSIITIFNSIRILEIGINLFFYFIPFSIHLLEILKFLITSWNHIINLFIIRDVLIFFLVIFLSLYKHFYLFGSFILWRFLIIHSSLNNHFIKSPFIFGFSQYGFLYTSSSY